MEHRVKKQLKKQKLKLKHDAKVHIEMPPPDIQYRCYQPNANLASTHLPQQTNGLVRLQTKQFSVQSYVVRMDCPLDNNKNKSVTLQRKFRHTR